MLYYARANVCLDTTGWWFCQHLSFVQTVGMKRDATWPTLPPIKSVYNTSYVGIINYLPHPLPGWTPTSSPRRQPTQLHVPCCTPRTGKSCVCVCVCVCVCTCACECVTDPTRLYLTLTGGRVGVLARRQIPLHCRRRGLHCQHVEHQH